MVVILMGVAGAGKTLVGRALASALGWPFEDADAYHSPANVEKLRRGEALSDGERAPWLGALHAVVARAAERREPLVLACSALKARYRDALRGGLRGVRYVHLEVDEATLRHRLAARRDHFVGPALIPSQLATLEPPTDAVVVDGTWPVDRIVASIRNELGI